MNCYLKDYFGNISQSGFDFTNYDRNEWIQKADSSQSLPRAKSTGTTIVGVLCKDCVVLGTDTRATNGPIVADKDCEKLHRLADNIYAAGAGTAADLEHVTLMIECQLELLRLQLKRKPRVITAITLVSQHLFKYQGHIGAALLIGGHDHSGPHLYSVAPHGSTDELPFIAYGSGMLNAIGILESQYRDNMTEEEGIKLISEAISAGIYNDLGSGSNVNIRVISANGTRDLHHYDTSGSKKQYQTTDISFPIGTTEYLSEKVEKIKPLITEITTKIRINDVDMTAN